MGTGNGDDKHVPSGVLLGPADIARLSGVRRPAVSNWRRRFDDFPVPVAGTSANPLFAMEQVRAWCRERGKPFRVDEADLLWQRVRTEVADVRHTEFLAHVAKLLTGELPRQSSPEATGWPVLVEEVLAAEDPQEMFERLALHWSAGRGRAETDAELGGWMADVAQVGIGDRVLDPSCGGGGLLVAAARRGATMALGQDRDTDAVAIASSRLAHLVRTEVTAVQDTLRSPSPALEEEPADVVLCDPPFRDRDWGQEDLAADPRWVYGLPSRGESELAWVQHCLSQARPGGRVVVMVPASVSYRPGGRRIRANLLRAGALRAVLDVPGDSAETGRQIWVMVRPEEESVPQSHILLVGAVDREESLRLYLNFLKGSPPEDEPRALVLEVADLIDEEVDLRPARHLAQAHRDDTAAHYPPMSADLVHVLEEALSLTRELELMPMNKNPGTTLGKLLDEGALELRRAPVAMAVNEGTLPVLTVQDLRSGQGPSGRCMRVPGLVMTIPGDVVVAENVRESPVRVVEESGAALGPRLLLLRPVPGRIDPMFLAEVVVPETVSAFRTSSGRADLRSLPLPSLPLAGQRAHARAWRHLKRQRELGERVAELSERLAELANRGLREGELRPRGSRT